MTKLGLLFLLGLVGVSSASYAEVIGYTSPGKWTVYPSDRYMVSRSSPASISARVVLGRSAVTYASERKVETTANQNCLELYHYYYNRHHWWDCNGGNLKIESSCNGGAYEVKYQSEVVKNDQNFKWTRISFDLPKGECKLRITATQTNAETRKNCHQALHGIDDLKVSSGSKCSDITNPSSLLTCSFTHGNCGWKDVGDIKWNQTNDPAIHVFGTGPRYIDYKRVWRQHFTGGYSYVNTSSANIPNKVAKLESPTVRSSIKQCLRMFVNMNGEDEGSLKVSVVQNGNTKTLYSIAGNQGTKWYEIRFDDLPINQDYKVVVEVKTGNGYLGDTAIDSIILEDGACFENSEVAKCRFNDKEDLYEGETCILTRRDKRKECAYETGVENVNGEDVEVFKTNYTTCQNHLYLTINMSYEATLLRKGCLSFDYKFSETACLIRIDQKWKNPNNYQRQWHWKGRVSDSNELSWGHHEVELDYKVKDSMNQVIMEFRTHYWHCRHVKLANVKIVEGICDRSGQVLPGKVSGAGRNRFLVL